MPKAHSTRSKASSARKDPIAKPEKEATGKTKAKRKTTKAASDDDSPETSIPKEKATRKDTGKNSHLYTDDNPSTTLHGTGFRDAETANNTISLISKRSLTYQFQTVNTLYHRASNHPSVKKAKAPDNDGPQGIIDALTIFRTWLDETYPASKAALRVGGGFKPLLSKTVVTKIMPALEANKAKIGPDALEFAKLYTSLPKNRRLGNVLIDDEKPGEADWEVKRYEALASIVPEDKEDSKSWEKTELWDGEGGLSAEHLKLVAWAWSPVGDRGLAKVEV